jgi:hypothetical protein
MTTDARLLELVHEVYVCSRNRKMPNRLSEMERAARDLGFVVQIDRKRKAVGLARLNSACD